MIFTLTYSICVSKKDKIKKDVQKCFSVGFFREETYLRVKGANIDERYFVLFFQKIFNLNNAIYTREKGRS